MPLGRFAVAGRVAGQEGAVSARVKLCAWCPDAAAVSELFSRSGDSVTHSICGTCAREVMSGLEQEEEADELFGAGGIT